MRISTILKTLGVAGILAVIVVWGREVGPERLAALLQLVSGSPHERYAASLVWTGDADTATGRQWLAASRDVLERAPSVRLPQETSVEFLASKPTATAFAVSLRRGQRYIATVDAAGSPSRFFLDLFARDGADLRHVRSALANESTLTLEPVSDGEFVLRVQPELGRDVSLTLTLRTEPTLGIPVEGATRSRIQSFFGDPRDRGRRAHHGVDIFAPRGTPVLAAADGVVSRVGTNRLGGNIVSVVRPVRGEMHYYAHLDSQSVSVGTLVKRGDVLGTVGNTGNAATTAPHLHFGIYAPDGPVDPLPYLAASDS